MFVASRVAVLLFLAGRQSDVDAYAGLAELIRQGQVPFRDFVPIYPPLAVWFATLPAVLDRTGHHYAAAYRGLVCVADLFIWASLLWSGRRGWLPCLLYLVCTTALGAILYDRLDLVLGATLCLAVGAVRRGRYGWASAAVGLGIAYKVIPVVLVPVLLVDAARRGWRALATVLLAGAVPVVLSIAPNLLAGGTDAGPMFLYHGQRPIQLESVPASVEMVLMPFGLRAAVTHGSGSFNLESSAAPGIELVASGVMGLAILAISFGVGRRGRDRQVRPRDVNLTLTVALVCSKVLSTQYLLWWLPPLLVAMPPAVGRPGKAQGGLLVVACVASGVLFPWWYADLVALRPGPVALMLLRNACLLLIAAGMMLPGDLTADEPGSSADRASPAPDAGASPRRVSDAVGV